MKKMKPTQVNMWDQVLDMVKKLRDEHARYAKDQSQIMQLRRMMKRDAKAAKKEPLDPRAKELIEDYRREE